MESELPPIEEDLPLEVGDPAEACASVPSSTGFWAMLQAMLRGQITGAAVALVIRQAAIMGLSLGSSVAVARWLGPEVVGRFAIVIFITQGILGYFGDLGLKASLIRKRGELQPDELSTAQIVVLCTSVLFAAGTGALLPVAFRLVKLGPENYLPAAIFLVLLIVRLQRMVPLAQLERAMRFKAVSTVETAESLIYTVLLIILAYLHRGIWCYVVAMGCRDLFGSTAFNLISRTPWRRFSWAAIRPHVGFSLMYQGATIANMMTLAFPPIFIARLLGQKAVGYASWAATLSLYPLVICNAMARIYLPAFSSAAQANNRRLLYARVEKSLRINASVAWPLCGVLASLSAPIIAFIYTGKWERAQPLLWAYCVNAVLCAVTVPLTEFFFADNDAWFNFRFCVLYSVLTWAGGAYAVLHYGLNGFALWEAVMQGAWILVFRNARKSRPLRVFAPLRQPLIWTAALVLANLLLTRAAVISSFPRLVAVLALEGLACGALLLRMVWSWRSAETGDA
jgi:O-antigen/teichoic acid export membrane protein